LLQLKTPAAKSVLRDAYLSYSPSKAQAIKALAAAEQKK
jgi:hypothetical protein